MVVVFSAVADVPWPAEVLAGLLELGDELPHAAVTGTAAVSRPAQAICYASDGLPSEQGRTR